MTPFNTILNRAEQNVENNLDDDTRFNRACEAYCHLIDYFALDFEMSTKRFAEVIDRRGSLFKRIEEKDREKALKFLSICAQHNKSRRYIIV